MVSGEGLEAWGNFRENPMFPCLEVPHFFGWLVSLAACFFASKFGTLSPRHSIDFYSRMKVFFVRPYVHGYAAYACLIDFVDNFTTG